MRGRKSEMLKKVIDKEDNGAIMKLTDDNDGNT